VARGVGRRLRRPRPLIEIEVDDGLVRRLLEQQFPEWASLPIRQATTMGTVNALFRLGDELVVRVPRPSSRGGRARGADERVPLAVARAALDPGN
jgi:aminoglycoside phosphotransferase (APT) family kinase protein